MAPLAGNLESVYSLYNLQESDGPIDVSEELYRRDISNPPYTNYCVDFKGTLDHILYNKNTIEVLEFLEMPPDTLIK